VDEEEDTDTDGSKNCDEFCSEKMDTSMLKRMVTEGETIPTMIQQYRIGQSLNFLIYLRNIRVYLR
jgi:hypothetical protein